MGVDITVKIGGEAGQGIQTLGEAIAMACQKSGMYVMAINDFESRIRGGHSFFQIRISDHRVYAPNHRVNLLVALNKNTYEFHKEELLSDGLVMMEAKDDVEDKRVVQVPITELAGKAGGKITSNTVAAGACLSLLGLPCELLEKIIDERFGKKGEKVLKNNILAARMGYEAVKDVPFKWAGKYAGKCEQESSKGTLINGAKAIALGALASDCRFASFYPMSPATGIMTYFAGFTEKFPVVVEQAEDEIAAVNMVIGANFAGIRSFTATSGGGFCLMTEGLGLAGITETPLVIVNAQRPGPATGLPTRTLQGDLLFVINASQDDFPRFVFAPGSVDEAFDITQKAFDLSEKYQVPAIILADQFLNDSLFIAEKTFEVPREIKRYIASDDDVEDPENYHRYAFTSSGISKRVLPCAGRSQIRVSGNEHTQDGHISEDASNRTKMVNKRMAKVEAMTMEMTLPEIYYLDSDILLVGWGSTKGRIKESVDLLRKEGKNVGCMHFKDIWPFKAKEVFDLLQRTGKFFMVEENSTAQMGSLIRQMTGLNYNSAILKYDGRPIYPEDIVKEIKKHTE